MEFGSFAELLLHGRFELASSNVLKLRLVDDRNNGTVVALFCLSPAHDTGRVDVTLSTSKTVTSQKTAASGGRYYVAGILLGNASRMLKAVGSTTRMLPALQDRDAMLPRSLSFPTFVEFVKGTVSGLIGAPLHCHFVAQTCAGFRYRTTAITLVANTTGITVSSPRGVVQHIQTGTGILFWQACADRRNIYTWRSSGVARMDRIILGVVQCIARLCRMLNEGATTALLPQKTHQT
jgi:hypothetical protein